MAGVGTAGTQQLLLAETARLEAALRASEDARRDADTRLRQSEIRAREAIAEASDARAALSRLQSITKEGGGPHSHAAHELELQQLQTRLSSALNEAELARQRATQNVEAAKVKAELRVSRAESSLRISEERLTQLTAQHAEHATHLGEARRLAEQAAKARETAAEAQLRRVKEEAAAADRAAASRLAAAEEEHDRTIEALKRLHAQVTSSRQLSLPLRSGSWTFSLDTPTASFLPTTTEAVVAHIQP
jgi:hypothetical protein